MYAAELLLLFRVRTVVFHQTVILEYFRDSSFFSALCVIVFLAVPCIVQGGYEEDIRYLAKQGDAEAQYALALLYEYGSETTGRDRLKSFYLLQKSAGQELAGACLYLGMKYEYGNGVDQDYKKALCNYLCAARQGWPMAQYFLADFYVKGKGVAKSIPTALAWLGLAREFDYPGAESDFLKLQKQSGVHDFTALKEIQGKLMGHTSKSCN